MMETTTRLTSSRYLGLQTFRGAWQRLSMILLMMMFTATTVWAEDIETYYIDANGTHDVTATVLTGNETNLSAGWYVVNSNISYTVNDTGSGKIFLAGDVNIILADGKTMNIGTSGSRQIGIGINGYFSPTNLTIYGQSLHEATAGQLSIYTDAAPTVNASGILIQGTYTQHSGNVTINSSRDAISVNGDITINGGKLDATTNIGQTTPDDIYALRCTKNITMNGGILNAIGNSYGHAGKSANGIYGTVTMTGGTLTAIGITNGDNSIGIEGDVTFSGGTLTATSTATVYGTPSTGIKGNATLSWTSADDRFTASSYDGDYTVTIADGQAFTTDGTDIYSGTLSSDDKTAIAGKKLRPVTTPILTDNTDNADRIATLADGQPHDIMLLGRTLYKDGNWNTLCLPFNVTLSGSPLAGAEARPLSEASITGTTLTLNFGDAVSTLAAGTPYIIKWESGVNIVNPVFEGVTISSAKGDYDTETASPAVTTDERVRFLGTYESIPFDGVDKSILFLSDGNTLYYPESGAIIGACRAYFKIGEDGAGARQITAFNLDFGDSSESTGIREIDTDPAPSPAPTGVGRAEWYTMEGVKLSVKPTKSGVYIHNGKKVLIP